MKNNEILELFGSDSKQAFDALFKAYSSMVFNVCLNFLQNTEDAEEIAQDVFIDAFKNISKFNQHSSLKTWIYRIAVNKSMEKIRYRNRKKRFGIFLSISDANHTESLICNHPAIEEEKVELASLLQVQIEKLADKQREAFIMHHVEGLSYQEISEIMKTSLSSVESLIFRAKRKLKKMLEIKKEEL
ncbi:MAG: RNA polymerase sigma factor [Reichenbachiella sp.]